jgi:hypothetical protein
MDMNSQPIVLTDDEMILIGIALMDAAENLATTRDALQMGLNTNQISGGIQAILTAMEMVDISNHQIDIIGKLLEKLAAAAPG